MNNCHAPEEAKRSRVMGDIPVELINEVMSTITDPAGMLGPEVSSWEGLLVALPYELSEMRVGY